MPAAAIAALDAHEQPSGYLRSRWKAYARATADEIEQAADVDAVDNGALLPAGTLPHDRVSAAFDVFLDAAVEPGAAPTADIPIYAHPLLPGLLVIPALVPPAVQTRLLDRMVHRDLSRPCHQTNLHPHYVLPYPPGRASFFSYAPDDKNDSATRAQSATFRPKDPVVHRPLSISQVLERRLHWVTLGGQYDWTHRVYPKGSHGNGSSDDDDDDDEDDEDDDDTIDGNENRSPRFPPRLARLLKGLFPETKAQAAIVNFYTPGDTMMMHRDVSEETDKGLISLSMGCDALFMAAPTREFGQTDDTQPATEDGDDGPRKQKPYVLLRLRSGDAIYMTGHARFAWHGVPKVIKGTCPDFLAEWPAGEHDDGRYEAWRGWMRNKRVNLNARQMRD